MTPETGNQPLSIGKIVMNEITADLHREAEREELGFRLFEHLNKDRFRMKTPTLVKK